MPVSTQSDPAYKKRRIIAMLEEPAFRELSHSIEHPPLTWSPRFVCAVIGLACLCALSVFLVLYHHDASTASASAPAAVVARPTEVQAKAASPAQGQEVAGTRSLSVPEPFEFKLKRSAKYQTVGPVGLRLLRVSLRRRVCDLSIQLEGHRRLQRHLQLNRPLQFKATPSGNPLEITVSSLSRDSAAGSLATVSAAPAPELKASR